MNLESWFVLTVAAAFLLLGIAGSPLAWVALHHRKSRLEQLMESAGTSWPPSCVGSRAGWRWRKQAGQSANGEARALVPSENGSNGRSSSQSAVPLELAPKSPRRAPNRKRTSTSMISVPNLAAAPERPRRFVEPAQPTYAAIWTLADQGASPEVIAKATGQPIGQIELILGLRRHIDGSRTDDTPCAPRLILTDEHDPGKRTPAWSELVARAQRAGRRRALDRRLGLAAANACQLSPAGKTLSDALYGT